MTSERDERPPVPTPARLDPQVREAIFDSLLRAHPNGFVTAIDAEPTGFFVPMPPSITLRGQMTLQGRTALDLVVPLDRAAVIESWELARSAGAARATVHLAADPSVVAFLQFVDLREQHGVYVGLLVPQAESEALFAAAPGVHALPARIGRARKNELAIFLEVDEALTRILGWTPDQMIGHRALEFIHPDEQERAIQTWLQMLERSGSVPAVRLRHKRADGGWTWFEVSNRNLLADPGRRCVETDMIDISDEMAAQDALRSREQLLRRLAEALPVGVCQARADGRIVYTNERLHRILGTPLALSIDEQLATVLHDGRPALDAALDDALQRGLDADLEADVRPSASEPPRRCLFRLRALNDELGAATGALMTVEDVTESAQMRAELERRATLDMLTRLLNRASVLSALDAALGRSAGGIGVIFIDLDRFKSVNDRLGHAAGDDVLRRAADRLSVSVRSGDIVGRIGGDEFLVVCPNLESVDALVSIGERVSRSLAQPIELAGTTVELRASVGLAFASGRRLGADALVRHADAAMYESKRRANGLPVVFSATIGRAQRVA